MKIQVATISISVVGIYLFLQYLSEIAIIATFLLFAKLIHDKDREIQDLRAGLEQLGR